MTRSAHPWFSLGLGVAAAAALLAPSPARAVGDNAGELLGGGTAKGDISKEPGETDRVGVDLIAGEPVNISWSAGFNSTLTFTDPDALPVDIGDNGDHFRLSGFVVPKSGRYEFSIASSDGTQGFWKLSVRPAWELKFEVGGAGDMDLPVVMPAGSSVSAKIRSVSTPSLTALVGPDQQNVLGPLPGTGELLKVPKTATALPGGYLLRLDVADDAAVWTGKVKRTLPKFVATKINLTNGLTPISYDQDGIDTIFAMRCGSCHSWARSYAGVRAYASESLSRIRTGNMPQGSSMLPADQIALIAAWIQTGKGR